LKTSSTGLLKPATSVVENVALGKIVKKARPDVDPDPRPTLFQQPKPKDTNANFVVNLIFFFINIRLILDALLLKETYG
jgi:hypothetical protein